MVHGKTVTFRDRSCEKSPSPRRFQEPEGMTDVDLRRLSELSGCSDSSFKKFDPRSVRKTFIKSFAVFTLVGLSVFMLILIFSQAPLRGGRIGPYGAPKVDDILAYIGDKVEKCKSDKTLESCCTFVDGSGADFVVKDCTVDKVLEAIGKRENSLPFNLNYPHDPDDLSYSDSDEYDELQMALAMFFGDEAQSEEYPFSAENSKEQPNNNFHNLILNLAPNRKPTDSSKIGEAFNNLKEKHASLDNARFNADETMRFNNFIKTADNNLKKILSNQDFDEHLDVQPINLDTIEYIKLFNIPNNAQNTDVKTQEIQVDGMTKQRNNDPKSIQNPQTNLNSLKKLHEPIDSFTKRGNINFPTAEEFKHLKFNKLHEPIDSLTKRGNIDFPTAEDFKLPKFNTDVKSLENRNDIQADGTTNQRNNDHKSIQDPQTNLNSQKKLHESIDSLIMRENFNFPTAEDFKHLTFNELKKLYEPIDSLTKRGNINFPTAEDFKHLTFNELKKLHEPTDSLTKRENINFPTAEDFKNLKFNKRNEPIDTAEDSKPLKFNTDVKSLENRNEIQVHGTTNQRNNDYKSIQDPQTNLNSLKKLNEPIDSLTKRGSINFPTAEEFKHLKFNTPRNNDYKSIQDPQTNLNSLKKLQESIDFLTKRGNINFPTAEDFKHLKFNNPKYMSKIENLLLQGFNVNDNIPTLVYIKQPEFSEHMPKIDNFKLQDFKNNIPAAQDFKHVDGNIHATEDLKHVGFDEQDLIATIKQLNRLGFNKDDNIPATDDFKDFGFEDQDFISTIEQLKRLGFNKEVPIPTIPEVQYQFPAIQDVIHLESNEDISNKEVQIPTVQKVQYTWRDHFPAIEDVKHLESDEDISNKEVQIPNIQKEQYTWRDHFPAIEDVKHLESYEDISNKEVQIPTIQKVQYTWRDHFPAIEDLKHLESDEDISTIENLKRIGFTKDNPTVSKLEHLESDEGISTGLKKLENEATNTFDAKYDHSNQKLLPSTKFYVQQNNHANEKSGIRITTKIGILDTPKADEVDGKLGLQHMSTNQKPAPSTKLSAQLDKRASKRNVAYKSSLQALTKIDKMGTPTLDEADVEFDAQQNNHENEKSGIRTTTKIGILDTPKANEVDGKLKHQDTITNQKPGPSTKLSAQRDKRASKRNVAYKSSLQTLTKIDKMGTPTVDEADVEFDAQQNNHENEKSGIRTTTKTGILDTPKADVVDGKLKLQDVSTNQKSAPSTKLSAQLDKRVSKRNVAYKSSLQTLTKIDKIGTSTVDEADVEFDAQQNNHENAKSGIRTTTKIGTLHTPKADDVDGKWELQDISTNQKPAPSTKLSAQRDKRGSKRNVAYKSGLQALTKIDKMGTPTVDEAVVEFDLQGTNINVTYSNPFNKVKRQVNFLGIPHRVSIGRPVFQTPTQLIREQPNMKNYQEQEQEQVLKMGEINPQENYLQVNNNPQQIINQQPFSGANQDELQQQDQRNYRPMQYQDNIRGLQAEQTFQQNQQKYIPISSQSYPNGVLQTHQYSVQNMPMQYETFTGETNGHQQQETRPVYHQVYNTNAQQQLQYGQQNQQEQYSGQQNRQQEQHRGQHRAPQGQLQEQQQGYNVQNHVHQNQQQEQQQGYNLQNYEHQNQQQKQQQELNQQHLGYQNQQHDKHQQEQIIAGQNTFEDGLHENVHFIQSRVEPQQEHHGQNHQNYEHQSKQQEQQQKLNQQHHGRENQQQYQYQQEQVIEEQNMFKNGLHENQSPQELQHNIDNMRLDHKLEAQNHNIEQQVIDGMLPGQQNAAVLSRNLVLKNAEAHNNLEHQHFNHTIPEQHNLEAQNRTLEQHNIDGMIPEQQNSAVLSRNLELQNAEAQHHHLEHQHFNHTIPEQHNLEARNRTLEQQVIDGTLPEQQNAAVLSRNLELQNAEAQHHNLEHQNFNRTILEQHNLEAQNRTFEQHVIEDIDRMNTEQHNSEVQNHNLEQLNSKLHNHNIEQHVIEDIDRLHLEQHNSGAQNHNLEQHNSESHNHNIEQPVIEDIDRLHLKQHNSEAQNRTFEQHNSESHNYNREQQIIEDIDRMHLEQHNSEPQNHNLEQHNSELHNHNVEQPIIEDIDRLHLEQHNSEAQNRNLEEQNSGRQQANISNFAESPMEEKALRPSSPVRVGAVFQNEQVKTHLQHLEQIAAKGHLADSLRVESPTEQIKNDSILENTGRFQENRLVPIGRNEDINEALMHKINLSIERQILANIWPSEQNINPENHEFQQTKQHTNSANHAIQEAVHINKDSIEHQFLANQPNILPSEQNINPENHEFEQTKQHTNAAIHGIQEAVHINKDSKPHQILANQPKNLPSEQNINPENHEFQQKQIKSILSVPQNQRTVSLGEPNIVKAEFMEPAQQNVLSEKHVMNERIGEGMFQERMAQSVLRNMDDDSKRILEDARRIPNAYQSSPIEQHNFNKEMGQIQHVQNLRMGQDFNTQSRRGDQDFQPGLSQQEQQNFDGIRRQNEEMQMRTNTQQLIDGKMKMVNMDQRRQQVSANNNEEVNSAPNSQQIPHIETQQHKFNEDIRGMQHEQNLRMGQDFNTQSRRGDQDFQPGSSQQEQQNFDGIRRQNEEMQMRTNTQQLIDGKMKMVNMDQRRQQVSANNNEEMNFALNSQQIPHMKMVNMDQRSQQIGANINEEINFASQIPYIGDDSIGKVVNINRPIQEVSAENFRKAKINVVPNFLRSRVGDGSISQVPNINERTQQVNANNNQHLQKEEVSFEQNSQRSREDDKSHNSETTADNTDDSPTPGSFRTNDDSKILSSTESQLPPGETKSQKQEDVTSYLQNRVSSEPKIVHFNGAIEDVQSSQHSSLNPSFQKPCLGTYAPHLGTQLSLLQQQIPYTYDPNARLTQLVPLNIPRTPGSSYVINPQYTYVSSLPQQLNGYGAMYSNAQTQQVQAAGPGGQYYVCNPIAQQANQVAGIPGVEVRLTEPRLLASESKHNSSATARQSSDCPFGYEQCSNSDRCIRSEHICDGEVHCQDGSDEAYCSCKYRVGPNRLCDGYFDCPNGEDEVGCFGCASHEFNCDDWSYGRQSTCIPLHLRCNGVEDCPTGFDERDCSALLDYVETSQDPFKVSNSVGFLHRNYKGRWYPACYNPEIWALEACKDESSPSILPPVTQMVSAHHEYTGSFLNSEHENGVKVVPHCVPNRAVYVECPQPTCGMRKLRRNPYRREEVDTSGEEILARFRPKRKALHVGDYVKHIYKKFSGDGDASKITKSSNGTEPVLGGGRVVGGTPCQPGAWPWVVSIYKNGAFHCGGVLISDSWVITAAHCVEKFWMYYYEVELGMLRRFSYSPMQQTRYVSHIIPHPFYDHSNLKNDLALVKLHHPVKFNRYVKPICLPTEYTAGQYYDRGPLPGTVCTAVGWGATVEHGSDPDHMREVEVPVLPYCKHKEDEEGQEICAGLIEGGKDACQGDSGGPFLCRNPNIPEQWYLAGIVSHGEGCARPNEPGVYTRVPLYRHWIYENAKDDMLPTRRPLRHCPGYTCKTINKCIPKKRYCDKVVDCLYGDDEVNCDRRRSFSSLFKHVVLGYDDLSRTSDPEDLPAGGDSIVDGATSNVEKKPITDAVNGSGSDGSFAGPAFISDGDKFISKAEDGSADGGDKEGASVPHLAAKSGINSTVMIKPFKGERFLCGKMLQVIAASRRCDREVDCEDGSDEMGCKCADYLRRTHQEALCDGITDCEDLSDEEGCASCGGDGFHCRLSGSCIPIEKKCDNRKDCGRNEDEWDCLALADGHGVHVDADERPVLFSEGYIAANVRGSWTPLCLNFSKTEAQTIAQTAADVCVVLGYSGYERYMQLQVLNRTLPVIRSDGVAPAAPPGGNCSALYVRCTDISAFASDHLEEDLQVHHVPPWNADVYADATYRCSGTVLNEKWVLTSINCFPGILELQRHYVAVLLGTSRGYLSVGGPHEQIIPVVEALHVADADAVLLRLKNDLKYTRYVRPLHFKRKGDFVRHKETCTATGKGPRGRPGAVALEPVQNCTSGFRCFRRLQAPPPECEVSGGVGMAAPWSGCVVCDSGNGFYPAAAYHDAAGECGFLHAVALPSIAEAKTNIFRLMERATFNVQPPKCDGFRCTLGECISEEKNCNGIPNCRDASDEDAVHCEELNRRCHQTGTCVCLPDEMRCKSGKCVPKTVFCDQKADCEDGSDEPDRCNCRAYLELADSKKICDGVRHCLDKSDEDPLTCNCTKEKFKCHRSSHCVPNDMVCDGQKDCPDNEDEEQCNSLYSKDDNPNRGEVVTQTSGVWHPGCFSEDLTTTELEAICARMGFIGGSAVRFNSTVATAPRPHLEPFSVVWIHRGFLRATSVRLALRSGLQDFVSFQQDSSCRRLSMECL